MTFINSWFDQISMRKKLLACFSVPIFLIVFVSTVVFKNTQSMSHDNKWVVHTHVAIARAQELLKLVVDMETGMRGFLITGDEEFLEPYQNASSRWDNKLTTLMVQVSDNPPQVKLLRQVDDIYQDWKRNAANQALLQRTLVNKNLAPMSSIETLIKNKIGKSRIDNIRNDVKAFIEEEERLIQIRVQKSEQSALYTSFALIVGSLLAIIICIAMAIWSSHRINLRISQLVKATKHISERNFEQGIATLETNQESKQRDEITELSLDFYDMSLELQQQNKNMVEYNHQLQNETRRAEAAAKAKSEFLSTMSHEIRTPLNGVLGIAQIINNETKEEPIRDYSDMVLSSGQHLVTILNDILDFTKIEENKIELERIDFSFNQVTKPVMATMTSLAQEKNIKLVFQDEIPADTHMIGDCARLRQIIFNLVGNAIKFTEYGEVIVRVSFDCHQSLLTLEVKDTGIGIPQHQQANVFNAFEQADSSTTRQFGGTGLGLAIVKRLVDLMGGEIHLNSEVNIGTQFVINVPMDWKRVTDTTPHPIEDNKTSSQPLTILLAEDNRVNAIVAKKFCEEQGFTVDVASDGDAAVQMIQTKEYDLVIMDNHMPKMSGVEATEYIRNTLKLNTVIFAYTADVFKEAHDKLIQAGVNHILTKPLQFDSFDDALTRFASKIQNSSTQKQNSNIIDYSLQKLPLKKSKHTEEEVSSSPIINELSEEIISRNELIASMVRELDKAVNIILTSYSNKDFSTLRHSLHSLKGMTLSLGLPILSGLTRTIEQQVKNNILPSSSSMEKLVNLIQVNLQQGERMLERSQSSGEIVPLRK